MLELKNIGKMQHHSPQWGWYIIYTDIGFTVSRQNESRQRAELKVATYGACHTSINSVDHLGELICSTCDKDIKIHRTKCTALINHTIAPSMFTELQRDIGGAEYSLVIDESTDVSSVKQLCVVLQYDTEQSCVHLFGFDKLGGWNSRGYCLHSDTFSTEYWTGH